MTDAHQILILERQEDLFILLPKAKPPGFRDVHIEAEMQSIDHLLDATARPLMLVDLSGSRHYGSIIVGMIVNFSKRVSAKGGKLVLAALSKDMRQQLKNMKLDSFLDIFDTREMGLRALHQFRSNPDAVG